MLGRNSNQRNVKWKRLHRQQFCGQGSGKCHVMMWRVTELAGQVCSPFCPAEVLGCLCTSLPERGARSMGTSDTLSTGAWRSWEESLKVLGLFDQLLRTGMSLGQGWAPSCRDGVSSPVGPERPSGPTGLEPASCLGRRPLAPRRSWHLLVPANQALLNGIVGQKDLKIVVSSSMMTLVSLLRCLAVTPCHGTGII